VISGRSIVELDSTRCAVLCELKMLKPKAAIDKTSAVTDVRFEDAKMFRIASPFIPAL
jgi:hypothetical protein